MKRRVLLIAAAGLLCIIAWTASAREDVKATSANPEAAKLIDQAWAALDDGMGTRELDRALKALEAASKLDPQNDAILVEMAGDYFWRGYQMPADNDGEAQARNVFFQKGYDAAQRAMTIKETCGAHAWMASNLGMLKQRDGAMAQAAALPEITSHIEWIETHDKNYGHGYTARFWMGVLTRSPGAVVKMLGKDPDQVLVDIQAAVARDPDFLENYLFKAEFLQSEGKTGEALDVLDRIIAADPAAMPNKCGQNRLVQNEARHYWKQWAGKEHPNR